MGVRERAPIGDLKMDGWLDGRVCVLLLRL